MNLSTKFDFEEEAWYMENNKPKQVKIREVKIEFTYKGYSGQWSPGVTGGKYTAYPQEEWYKSDHNEKDWIPVSKLYKSKAELVAELMDVNLYL